jgi:hypothetical protein
LSAVMDQHERWQAARQRLGVRLPVPAAISRRVLEAVPRGPYLPAAEFTPERAGNGRLIWTEAMIDRANSLMQRGGWSDQEIAAVLGMPVSSFRHRKGNLVSRRGGEFTDARRALLVEMFAKDFTHRQMAKALNVSIYTVIYQLRNRLNLQHYTRPPGSNGRQTMRAGRFCR